MKILKIKDEIRFFELAAPDKPNRLDGPSIIDLSETGYIEWDYVYLIWTDGDVWKLNTKSGRPEYWSDIDERLS